MKFERFRNTGRAELGPVLPEEALFLLENNCLHLTRSDVPLSLQAAFSLLLSPETGLSLEMYLVYSKLTRDGYKLVRCREDGHYEAGEDIEDISAPFDSDIDSKMILPLFGSELMDFSRHNSHSSWTGMKDIVIEVISSSVEVSNSDSRKRKAVNTQISKNAKQQKFVPEDKYSLPPSPKYEADLDPEDIPEVIELEDENDEEKLNHNVFINPFHEENEEDDEDDTIEEIDYPVVDLEDDDGDAILITRKAEEDQNLKTFCKSHQESINCQQNMTSMVTSAIQMQVAAAEAMFRELQATALPTKLLEGPNQHLCKLCDVVCNTPEMLKIHEEGKKHKKKMLRIGGSDGQGQQMSGESFSCDICGISCSDGTALVAHFKGKRHLKAMNNRAELNSGSANAKRLTGGDSPDDDIMIVTDKCPPPPGVTPDEADDDIELITGDEKTQEEILQDLPNCDPRKSLQLIKPQLYLIPPNTWPGSKISCDINVPELFNPFASTRCQSSSADSSVDALFIIDTQPRSHEEITLLDDDDEIILVEEENQRKKKKVTTPLSRPFRGLYPNKEYVTPLASVDGVYKTIRNFGFHIKPPKPKPLINTNKRAFKVKHSKMIAKNITVKEIAEDVMGIGGCDNSIEGEEQGSGEKIDFDDLAARAKAWIAQCNVRKALDNAETNCDINAGAIEKSKQDLLNKSKDNKTIMNNLKKVEVGDFVDLGSSDEEMEDDDNERSVSSSSDYSDDISAHSELRYFKHGPLSSLWNFEDKVGPLICPEMAGSMREIYNRLRMEPPEPVFKDSSDGVKLEAYYDVFLAENYKKNSKTPPNYRIVIQDFSSSLPSAQSMCHLDRKYHDSVPFLFAIVSGGTVSFFNVDRVDLPSYFKSI